MRGLTGRLPSFFSSYTTTTYSSSPNPKSLIQLSPAYLDLSRGQSREFSSFSPPHVSGCSTNPFDITSEGGEDEEEQGGRGGEGGGVDASRSSATYGEERQRHGQHSLRKNQASTTAPTFSSASAAPRGLLSSSPFMEEEDNHAGGPHTSSPFSGGDQANSSSSSSGQDGTVRHPSARPFGAAGYASSRDKQQHLPHANPENRQSIPAGDDLNLVDTVRNLLSISSFLPPVLSSPPSALTEDLPSSRSPLSGKNRSKRDTLCVRSSRTRRGRGGGEEEGRPRELASGEDTTSKTETEEGERRVRTLAADKLLLRSLTEWLREEVDEEEEEQSLGEGATAGLKDKGEEGESPESLARGDASRQFRTKGRGTSGGRSRGQTDEAQPYTEGDDGREVKDGGGEQAKEEDMRFTKMKEKRIEEAMEPLLKYQPIVSSLKMYTVQSPLLESLFYLLLSLSTRLSDKNPRHSTFSSFEQRRTFCLLAPVLIREVRRRTRRAKRRLSRFPRRALRVL